MQLPSSSGTAGAVPMDDHDRDVTVVIPFYNVERYIEECLDSVVSQTAFPNFEVVLVDDGATDSSATIAKKFVDAYPDVFRLHSQSNAGLGAARNKGISLVQTSFVMFLDSDDLLPPDALDSLYDAITRHRADLAVGAVESFPSVQEFSWMRYFRGKDRVVGSIADVPELIHGASVWNKIFRMDSLARLGVRCGEGVHFEDIYLTLPSLLDAGRIALVASTVYLYRKRADSIMDSVWTRPANFWDHLAAVEFLAPYLHSLPPSKRWVLENFMARSLQGFVLRAGQVLADDELGEYRRRVVGTYSAVSAASIAQGCLDLLHRLPYLAALFGDDKAFADPRDAVVGLRCVDGEMWAVTSYEVPTSHLDLLRVRGRVAYVESMDRLPRGRGIRVVGRYVLEGFAPTRPLEVELGVRLRGSGVTASARTIRRALPTRLGMTDTFAGFVADIPAKSIRPGTHQFRLVFVSGGQASSRMRPTLGARRGSRAVPIDGKQVLLRPDVHENATLLVGKTSTRRERVAWRWALAREDLRHALRRGPLWRPRLAHLLTAFLFRKSRIWLLGERADTAQDNSFALYRHLSGAPGSVKPYYVLDRKSAHWEKVRGYGNPVARDSWRHKLLLLHAEWLISSYDIDSYMLPSDWDRRDFVDHLCWRIGPRRAFLQHGVTHNDLRRSLHRQVAAFDVFVTSGPSETSWVRGAAGYAQQVAPVGMPRFDSLVARTARPRRILLMPTWRLGYTSPSYDPERPVAREFVGSRYESFYTELLNDERLLAALASADVTLEVLPHYEFAHFFAAMLPGSDRVVLSDQSLRDVQEAIRECSLLVTDWSSVFFDAAFLGVPVVTMPFDEDEFRSNHYPSSYFRMERDGFGPVALTPDDAVDSILGYVRNDFVREPQFAQRADAFFDGIIRGEASQRVANAIMTASSWPRELPELDAYGDRLMP